LNFLSAVGLATLEHLDKALAAGESGPLPEDALAKLNRVYESGFQHVE
jgi:hypothetical protein